MSIPMAVALDALEINLPRSSAAQITLGEFVFLCFFLRGMRPTAVGQHAGNRNLALKESTINLVGKKNGRQCRAASIWSRPLENKKK